LVHHKKGASIPQGKVAYKNKSYFKVNLGGSEQRDYKVLVEHEIKNINRKKIVKDFNYECRKFKCYFHSS
jgi:hypothetical protein